MKTNPDQISLFDDINKTKNDCTWFDRSPTGEPLCCLLRCSLQTNDEVCFYCNDYFKFEKGVYPSVGKEL